MATRTYVDPSVLIAAFRGEGALARRAFEVLDDPARIRVVSDYVRLEVLPKPIFHKQQEEEQFMREYCNAAEEVPSSPEVTNTAVDLASRYDLHPVDALHVASAVIARAAELVTLEKPGKPICKVREIQVTSLHSSRP